MASKFKMTAYLSCDFNFLHLGLSLCEPFRLIQYYEKSSFVWRVSKIFCVLIGRFVSFTDLSNPFINGPLSCMSRKLQSRGLLLVKKMKQCLIGLVHLSWVHGMVTWQRYLFCQQCCPYMVNSMFGLSRAIFMLWYKFRDSQWSCL
jgi:hypothetical protein